MAGSRSGRSEASGTKRPVKTTASQGSSRSAPVASEERPRAGARRRRGAPGSPPAGGLSGPGRAGSAASARSAGRRAVMRAASSTMATGRAPWSRSVSTAEKETSSLPTTTGREKGSPWPTATSRCSAPVVRTFSGRSPETRRAERGVSRMPVARRMRSGRHCVSPSASEQRDGAVGGEGGDGGAEAEVSAGRPPCQPARPGGPGHRPECVGEPERRVRAEARDAAGLGLAVDHDRPVSRVRPARRRRRGRRVRRRSPARRGHPSARRRRECGARRATAPAQPKPWQRPSITRVRRFRPPSVPGGTSPASASPTSRSVTHSQWQTIGLRPASW